MNSTKKIFALVLVFIMMLAMSVTAVAAGNVPKNTDTATVTVKNVEGGATVNLYRIVEPVYNTAGLEKYQAASGRSIANIEAPTAEEVSAIAQDISGLTSATATRPAGKSDYVATVGAGTWLVLVKGAGATVYNPMIVSVNYDEKSLPVAGEVDAETYYQLGDEIAYAKSSTPDVDKKITGTDSNPNCNENGNDVAIGDTVNYEIDTTIPSYSTQYTNVVFDVSDTLSKGLTLNYGSGKIKVTVDGAEVKENVNIYNLNANENGFTVSFSDPYIRANGGKAVVVTYSAKVNANADLNFDPNTNTAKIEFSNDPTDSGKTGTDEDKTYTYTFAIDGNLNGTASGKTYTTHEIIKVHDDGTVEVKSSTEDLDTVEVTKPLAGAVFTMTNNATKKVYTGTTNEKGYLEGFTGLDAGTYTLVETQAPEGYVTNTDEHSVVIAADYNDDGTLDSYTITIDGKETSTYEATYDSNGTITKIEGDEQDTLTIVNTKIPDLPATGGIGTTLFYVFGGLMVVAAGVMLVTKKRMSNKG